MMCTTARGAARGRYLRAARGQRGRALTAALSLVVLVAGADGAAANETLPHPSNSQSLPVTQALPRARPAQFYRPGAKAPPNRPQRIVSLAPVVTEALFAVGAGGRVVGVTRYCDRPTAAASLPRVGGYSDPSLERILSLRPDLVVAMPSFSQRALLDQLRDADIAVYVIFTDTLDEVRALPRDLGAAVGEPALGLEVARRMDGELRALENRRTRAPARVLVVVGVDPIVVAGPGTFADDVLQLLGATPVPARNGPAWPQWSPEAVLTARPDVVVAAEGPRDRDRLRKLLGASRARVVSADRPILMRPGPSLAGDARALATLLDDTGAP